jgi:hypothetical protein
MSGLTDAAKAAREHASGCTDPGCHRLAHALDAAEAAEARESLSELREAPGTTAIPTPEDRWRSLR